jgi:Xaa-Pro aminopeptidase
MPYLPKAHHEAKIKIKRKHMFSAATYTARRSVLAKTIKKGLILFMGNNDVGMNYTANTYAFRQDSNFLYYFGMDMPGLAAIIDAETGKTTVYGTDWTLEDIIWVGQQTGLTAYAAQSGVEQVKAIKQLAIDIKAARKAGRHMHYLPPYRHDNILTVSKLLGVQISRLRQKASEHLIKTVVIQRSKKNAEELAEMEKAVNTSGAMHIAAMQFAKPGMRESDIAALVRSKAIADGGDISYGIICTVDGHVLHNHHYHHTLKDGQMILLDAGAATSMHYAGDITRTFPVGKTFTPQQKDIYEIVLAAETNAIKMLRPGLPYRDVHLAAALIIAEGLKELGLMSGNMEDAVAQSAHALFFPHGLGHMIGLDVHDMEDLGENYVGYSDKVERSKDFGTAYLRLGRHLEEGFVLTVEPGIYFIPALLDKWRSEKKFKNYINYDRVEMYRDFTGIRIEDNVLVTATGHQVLGNPIPKTVAEIEALRASN